ncbi:MAG: leucine-rich repeat domain-containing protein [Candidatus Poribacteria bacterium]|nr:leucine-rich repeat domain-containing protein [Candidatus Poribacteria bacterium]
MKIRKIFQKLLWFQLLLLPIVGMFGYNVVVFAEDAEEWMPDANLRQAVRETLELTADEPLTKDKILRLKHLNTKDGGITDITGLEFASKLRVLLLDNNSITDLRPLANLIDLERLSLVGNRISDIIPLAGLMNLRVLHLSKNPITDLRPLANLTQLVELHFWHFPTNPTNLDLRPLTNLINLEVLSLTGNGISDITPLAGLKKLRELHIANNHIEDFSPLAGLTNLKKLWIQRNWTRDISLLLSLNLIEFHYDEVCDFIPLRDSVESRIKNRNFPSIVGMWPEGEESTKYDFNYGPSFGLSWRTSQTEPFGLRTQLSGNIEEAKAIHQQLLQRNPNILFFTEIRIHNHLPPNNTAFPIDSDFWLRDSEGRIVRNSNGEYVMNLLNPDLQDLLIERIVGFSECGIFDGILLDGFGGDANFGESVVEARIRILRGVRERVRDDFLIIVNANRKKPVQYAKYVNGSAMEPGEDYKGTAGGTYKLLQVLDETLLWNEENLRQPTVNWGEGFLLPDQPPDSPDNQRRARLFTARGLTHSDGYVRLTYAAGSWQKWMDTHNFWYSFWDADLGKPIGEKGQLCDNCDGLFIREFTNGWAVYNRSGKPQKIQIPMQATGVESGLTDTTHIVPDLDGEMFLKQEVGTTGDGSVKVLDLAVEPPQELESEWIPDAALRATVREALGLPAAAPLTKKKMLWLKRNLRADHSGIIDITGLEFATNLEALRLSGNPITDLRPITNLTALKNLYLSNLSPNTLSLDLHPLANLSNLEQLTLKNSKIYELC